MRIYFSRYRFKAGAEKLFMKARTGSYGIGRYIKWNYTDGIVWSLKGWLLKIIDKREQDKRQKEKHKKK